MSNNTNTFDAFLNNIENSGARTIQTLQEIGLDWQVNKVQLCTPDGTPVDYYANQRSDNNAVLHVVREGYNIFQNEELVELCETMANTFDYKIHSGGALHEGRKVFIQLETDSVRGIGQNNDTVNRYITAVNSFDGTTSVAFGSLGLTISCQNTFFRAARHENMTRIKHTASMHDKIEAAKRQIESVRHEEEELYKTFFAMSNAEATPEHVRNVVRLITKVDTNEKPEAQKEKHGTRKVNIAESLLASIRGEMSYKGETLWGLMSGVTHFTTHVQSAPKRENGRVESKLVGVAQDVDALAFEYLENVVA
jgi:phage/plasmid-like protein (TIGR03299 family)